MTPASAFRWETGVVVYRLHYAIQLLFANFAMRNLKCSARIEDCYEREAALCHSLQHFKTDFILTRLFGGVQLELFNHIFRHAMHLIAAASGNVRR